MSNTFFSSDHHFYHENVIKYSNRPFASVEEMHNALITSWNNQVKPKDRVYYMGDFTLDTRIDKIDEILGQLNGDIYLVRGNHDKWTSKIPRLKYAHKIKSVKDYDERSFSVEGQNTKVVLMHFPLRNWNRGHYGSIHLHGHVHGALDNENKTLRRFDVGVDSSNSYNYAPIPLDDIIFWAKDIEVSKNHHIGD